MSQHRIHTKRLKMFSSILAWLARLNFPEIPEEFNVQYQFHCGLCPFEIKGHVHTRRQLHQWSVSLIIKFAMISKDIAHSGMQ